MEIVWPSTGAVRKRASHDKSIISHFIIFCQLEELTSVSLYPVKHAEQARRDATTPPRKRTPASHHHKQQPRHPRQEQQRQHQPIPYLSSPPESPAQYRPTSVCMTPSPSSPTSPMPGLARPPAHSRIQGIQARGYTSRRLEMAYSRWIKMRSWSIEQGGV